MNPVIIVCQIKSLDSDCIAQVDADGNVEILPFEYSMEYDGY